MHIDFILDIQCLWSYLCWNHLQTALKAFPHFEISPFFVSSPASIQKNFFIKEKMDLLEKSIKPFFNELKLEINLEKLPVLQKDLSLIYQFVYHAFYKEKKYCVLDHLFQSYFLLKKNIADLQVLKEIAKTCGSSFDFFDKAVLPDLPFRFKQETLHAVPCLIFEKKAVIFGAQSVSCLKNMLFLSNRLKQETTSK